jgi:multiple sugar transport system substrate-binding protein
MGKPMDASRASWLIVGGALALVAILVASLAFVAVVLLPGNGNNSGSDMTFSQPYPTSAPQETFAPPTFTATLPPASRTIRWFVGLGSGSLAFQTDAERSFVSTYNATNADGITIDLEIVPSETAQTTLNTEIAAGNAPDIIGPLGLQAANNLQGQLLDLSSEIASQNVDMTLYDPAVVRYLQSGGAQIGIPYQIYPDCVWYNKDLFAAAGLPNLPTKVGDQYQGQTWDWDALTKVAAQLTVDQSGRKSTAAGFDKTKVKTYGVDFQWSNARSMAATFGGGSFVAADGRTAQIPQIWAEAYSWYDNAIWTQHIAPDASPATTTYLGDGGGMASGHVAMNVTGSWGLSLVGSGANVKNWDIGVLPSRNGNTSAPLEADTFVISRSSRNPDSAFKAMIALEADPTLKALYGGMPARTADQASYFLEQDAALAPTFPLLKVNWSVLVEMAKYPPVPSHDSYMPNPDKSITDTYTFFTDLRTTHSDVTAALAKLQQTLQADFDSAPPALPPT